MTDFTDEQKEVDLAMETARQACSAMSASFQAWANAQEPGSVYLVGAGSGVAQLAGLILQQIQNDAGRDAAVVGAVVTLMANAVCDMDLVLEKVTAAVKAYQLATAEAAGSA